MSLSVRQARIKWIGHMERMDVRRISREVSEARMIERDPEDHKDATGTISGKRPREGWRATCGGARTRNGPPGVERSRVSLMPITVGWNLSQVRQGFHT